MNTKPLLRNCRTVTLASALLIPTVSILEAKLAAELPPPDHFANPVLASKDAVIGAATEAIKLGVAIAQDYSILTASVCVQDYLEVHKTIFYNNGVPASQITSTKHHYLNSANPTSDIWESYITTEDEKGATTSPVDTNPFYHDIGRLNWTCVTRDATGKPVMEKSLVVSPTKLKIRVDAAKYAQYRLKYPTSVIVKLEAATDVFNTSCSLFSTNGIWSYTTQITPMTFSTVSFIGAGSFNSTSQDLLPSITIGYVK